MGRHRQSWLVVLVFVACTTSITTSSRTVNSIVDNVTDDSKQNEAVGNLKISTPKISKSSTNIKKALPSHPALKQLKGQLQAEDLKKEKESNVEADSKTKKLIPDLMKNKNDTNQSTKIVEIGDDYYNYDYDEDYSYDEPNSAEAAANSSTQASVAVEPTKRHPTTTTAATQTTTSTTTTTMATPTTTSTRTAPQANSKIGKLRPIKGDDKSTPNLNPDQTLDDDIITGDEDEDDDDDDDDDDDEDDDEYNDDITDEEEIIFNENVPCPRDCICARNVNSYLVATCSRLDPGKQKFGSDITDLVVVDVGPKYPILLGPEFFVKIGLRHVSSIKIANCTIEYLHQEAFKGLDDLYSINLTNVGLSIINPDTFVNNKKLRLLTISDNDLSIMSSVQYLLKSSSIEDLDLSRNNLMEVNENAFSQLSNIVYINLASNNLKKLPERVFDSVETIEELDLSYNMLKTLPPTIFNRTGLGILHLKYNEITGDLRFGIPDLQQLDLSFCSIKQVHHRTFDKLEGLSNLNLRGNGITKIQPDSFLSLKNLRHIDLSINELDQVSSLLFYKNSELSVIRLNDNPRLSQLPTDGFQSYNGYFNVHLLDVSNCAIGALGHNTFSTMPHLATLRLAWNNINNLDRDTFAFPTKLIELDLSNNLIVKLDELIFANNTDITKLNLAGNPIRKISGRLFAPLTKLRELDVSECELHTLITADSQTARSGRKYRFYETLRSLNASSNQIKKISVNDIKNFVNLRTLDISENPLKCNEDFQNFISYVSLNTSLVPTKEPMLANFVSSSFTDYQPRLGWTDLAMKTCKHHHHETVVEPTSSSTSTSHPERTIEEVEKDLEADSKKLVNLISSDKLYKMQKILKDSKKSETPAPPAAVDRNSQQTDAIAEDESKDNVLEDDDKLNSAVVGDGDDGFKNDYEYDSEDEDDEEDDEEDYDQANKKKADGIELGKESKITDGGAFADEVNLSKETRDKFLLNKFILNDDSDDDSQDNIEEIIIERGRIYYSGYKFLIPLTIIIASILVLLLAIAKFVSLIMRKRGERYRMALLASKNSIVYQKLSEEIKPLPKQPKHPKIHRYSPIEQV